MQKYLVNTYVKRASHVVLCCVLSHFTCDWLFVTLRAIASVHGILQVRIWSGLLCPPPGDLPHPGIKPAALMSPALAGRFLPLAPPGKSQLALVIKNRPIKVEEVRDVDWIPGSGRSPGRGHGNPFQYSCLENLVDKGAWWAMVHRVEKCWTRLKRLSTLTCECLMYAGIYASGCFQVLSCLIFKGLEVSALSSIL